jgi:hypothetical protein
VFNTQRKKILREMKFPIENRLLRARPGTRLLLYTLAEVAGIKTLPRAPTGFEAKICETYFIGIKTLVKRVNITLERKKQCITITRHAHIQK